MKGTLENPRRDLVGKTNWELQTVLKTGEWYYKRWQGKLVLRRWQTTKGISLELFQKIKADWAGRCVRANRQEDRKYGRTFNLTKEDVESMWEMNKNCHYCSDPMVTKDRSKNINGVTLERLDNRLGHSPENCVLACKDCNVTLHLSRVLEKMERNEHLRGYMLSRINEMNRRR